MSTDGQGKTTTSQLDPASAAGGIAAAPAGRADPAAPGIAAAGAGELVPMARRSFTGVRRRVLSLAVLVALWYVASLFFSDTVLPGPPAVFATLWGNLQHADTYTHLYKTVIRVVAGM